MLRMGLASAVTLCFSFAGPWTCSQFQQPDGGTSSFNPHPGGVVNSGGQGGTVSLTVDAGVTASCSGTLSISPANPTLAVNLDSAALPATLPLTAVCTTAGGSHPVSANWFSQRPGLAAVDYQTGVASSSGPMGGQVGIIAGTSGLVANATLTVVVTQTVFEGVPSTAPNAFQAPPTLGGSTAPALLYPLDQVIIPVNLPPIDFQWQPGQGNDLFRVTLSGPFANLIAYVKAPYSAPPQNSNEPSWQPAATDWSHFAQSNVGQSVTVHVDGVDTGAPGSVYGSTTRGLALARSRMAGEMYYWSVNLGRIFKVPAGATSPPVDIYNSNGCIACHAVSPDGTKLSAELWGGGQPGTVLNLTSNPASPIVRVGPDWDFSTFDPSGKYLVVSHDGDLTLRSATTGSPVPSGTGEGNLAPIGCGWGGECTQPAWSRDGHFLVFVKGKPWGWGSDWDFSASQLMLLTWLGGTSFVGPTVLATGDFDGQWLADVYPTISVDDSLVAFTRSPCSYGSNCPNSSRLDLVPTAGGQPIELGHAEGGDRSNRFPSFSPFKEGGYHWLAFFSQRDYGWVTAQTSRRQIWVAAVDDNGAPVSDSSHPAFWFPGQDFTSENDKAQWATLPCEGAGQLCQGDIDCCQPLLCGGASTGAAPTCMTQSQACTFSWDFRQVFQGGGGAPEFTRWDGLGFTYQPNPIPSTDDFSVSVRVANQQSLLASATPIALCDMNTPPSCANPIDLTGYNLVGAFLEVDFKFQQTSCSPPAAGQLLSLGTVTVTQTNAGN